jgi:phage N-6-adenine-methyltransferase
MCYTGTVNGDNTTRVMNQNIFTSRSEEWATPWPLFRLLDAEFHFSLDACATAENAKCAKFHTVAEDGLAQSWAGEVVFCNPPYGRKIYAWVRKCYQEGALGAATVVLLIPARTDTPWWHEYIMPHASEIRFIRGRVNFGGRSSATFPSVVVVFKFLHFGETRLGTMSRG